MNPGPKAGVYFKTSIMDKAEYKSGETHKALIPFGTTPYKIHIDQVFDSIYEGQKLIIYRVYGKHKQYWHEIMCSDSQMDMYISRANKFYLG